MEIDILGLGKKIAGFDIADEKRDKHSLYIRHGNKCIYHEDWLEGDCLQATQKAWMICESLGVEVINFDSIGVGAGAKGKFSELKLKAKEQGLKYNPEIKPINVASRTFIGFYAEGKLNKDMFFNQKARYWWSMRERAEATYNWVELVKQNYPNEKINNEFLEKNKIVVPDNIISLPDDPDLLEQLTQQQYYLRDNGLIIMKPKKEIYQKSPDKADACILSYAHSGYTQREFIII